MKTFPATELIALAETGAPLLRFIFSKFTGAM